MATKKAKPEQAANMVMPMKPCLHIDFDGNPNEVKGYAVGDEVNIAIRGTIRGIEQRESYDDPKKMMASVSLRDFEVKMGGGKSDIFDALESEPGEGD